MLLAAIDWTSVGVVLGVMVSALSAILVFVKGRKSDEALQSANLVQTAFSGQQTLVEALQEEVGRHSLSTQRCLNECDALRTALAKAMSDLSEARIEIKKLKSTQQVLLAKMRSAGVHHNE